MVVAQQNWNNSDLLGKFSLTGCPTCYKLLYIVGQLQELEMSTIKEVLKEELARLKRLKGRYDHDIALLPSGSLSIKTRKGNEYAYRAYRSNDKVKTDYIGPADSNEVKKFKEKIEKRKKLESLLKTTSEQIIEIERSLRGKKI